MKELKVIGQFLAAIVYSSIFTGILYLLMVLPVGWIMSLNTKAMVLVLIFGGGILQGLILLLQTLILAPYAWIVKHNIVSLVTSILIILLNVTLNIIQVWKATSGCGTLATIFAVICTILLVEAVFISASGIIGMYDD